MKKHRKLRIFIIALVALLLIIIAVALIKYFSGYEIYKDISYGDSEINSMDVYIPKRAYSRESNGCILFIHGGSWSGGDKAEETARCRLLASHGYIVASVNYTLRNEENAEEYTVFGVLDELDAALLRIKDFSDERGIQIDKAALSGYSAGAHLAMLYSYSRYDTAPIELAFTASMAGPADICPEVWGEDLTVRIAKLLTGEVLTEEELLTERAHDVLSSISPTSFISENTPPTLIMHGGRDTVVPKENAESLIEKLSQSRVPYDYIYLKDSDHMLIQNPIGHLSYYKTLIEYCKRYFNK